ncbi:MAG: hypothetical protein ACEPOV_11055 [Hyphomicrobiales bacterium]
MMKVKRLYIALSTILIIAFLSSCSSERMAASRYVSNMDKGTILVKAPTVIFQKNSNVYTDLDTITDPYLLDSISYARTLALKNIDEAEYLNTFVNKYMSSLRRYGYNVVYDNGELDKSTLSEPIYNVKIDEIEMDESSDSLQYTVDHNNLTYYQFVKQATLAINTWVILGSPSNKLFGTHLLFDEDAVAEDFDCKFLFKDNGEVLFDCDKTEIDAEVLKNMAEILGDKYAIYTFDFILNRMVKLDLGYKFDGMFHRYTYYPEKNILKKIPEEDGFIELPYKGK